MKIKFQYTSQIAMLANLDEEIIELENSSSIQSAIAKLLQNKSEEFKSLLFTKSNELLPAILLIKNGNQINYAENETLMDGDEILIFSPMSGG
jgi:molybdopterin converting factor small subunit